MYIYYSVSTTCRTLGTFVAPNSWAARPSTSGIRKQSRL